MQDMKLILTRWGPRRHSGMADRGGAPFLPHIANRAPFDRTSVFSGDTRRTKSELGYASPLLDEGRRAQTPEREQWLMLIVRGHPRSWRHRTMWDVPCVSCRWLRMLRTSAALVTQKLFQDQMKAHAGSASWRDGMRLVPMASVWTRRPQTSLALLLWTRPTAPTS